MLIRKMPLTLFAAFSALSASLIACKHTATEKPVQKTFASPDDAGAALLDAAKSGDQSVFLAIFGPDAKEALFSGDPVKDKDVLEDFVAAYAQMHRWREIRVGARDGTLTVGE